VAESTRKLSEIPVSAIVRNKENPRVVFRARDMEDLTDSIQKLGVQVPIAVYRDGEKYVLIDGERRWLSTQKLGRRTIPALIEERPSPLQNLLLMFNIHALREQWDLLTIALKLPRITQLLKESLGTEPTEAQLAEHTGLHRGTIRRCKMLMDLPQKYKDLILEELSKPKDRQQLTEDFFIEMERALKTVENAMPDVIPNKEAARQVMIRKYKDKVFVNRVDFRKMGRIARAEKLGGDRARAHGAMQSLLKPNKVSIEDAYRDSVSEVYLERDLVSRLRSFLDVLPKIRPTDVDSETWTLLKNVHHAIGKLLAKKK